MAILLNHSVGLMGRHPTALAVSLSLRQVSVECLSALVVMSLAGVPCQPLDPHYEQATATHTQTTFDHTLTLNPAQAATVRVPLWWYGVIALTEGLTHALRQSAIVPLDLRQLITTVHLTPLRDPHLRQQLTRFYQQCYTPARHTFLTQAPSPTALAHLQALLHVTPTSIEDTEWLGPLIF